MTATAMMIVMMAVVAVVVVVVVVAAVVVQAVLTMLSPILEGKPFLVLPGTDIVIKCDPKFRVRAVACDSLAVLALFAFGTVFF
jgi:hypothetical protein